VEIKAASEAEKQKIKDTKAAEELKNIEKLKYGSFLT